ncbi:MAG: hypothetical protein ACTHJ0_04160 [Flavipsychrobacter sp.]|jgi:hypothetical protein
MKRIYKLDKFIAHLLNSAAIADDDFNRQRTYLKREEHVYSLASDSLSMERISFSFSLTKYTPGLFERIMLLLRHINSNTVYDLCNTGTSDAVTVHVSLKRNSAYEAFTKMQDPDDLTKLYVRV